MSSRKHDELVAALRAIDYKVGRSQEHKAEAVRGYLDDIRNIARTALTKVNGESPRASMTPEQWEQFDLRR